MNRTAKLLSILMIISFGFSIDNKESETTTNRSQVVQLEEGQTSSTPSLNQSIAPIDINKINNIRINKDKMERTRAQSILSKHKMPKTEVSRAVNPNFEKMSVENQMKAQVKEDTKVSFFKKITQGLRSKYTVRTLESEDGKRAIKFPTENGKD